MKDDQVVDYNMEPRVLKTKGGKKKSRDVEEGPKKKSKAKGKGRKNKRQKKLEEEEEEEEEEWDEDDE
jgi:ribosomal protein L12E/L44/L45/RPP1/RPP2